LKKIFWPFDLAIFYPMLEQIIFWKVLAALLLILVISAFAFVTWKRLPYFFVGWLWYSITIVPVLGITYEGVHWMHDTYTYLPSIGISILLAWGIPFLLPNKDVRKNFLFPAATACLVIMTLLTWMQCGYWENSIELFSHNLHINNDYLAYDHRGIAYGQSGQYEKAIEDFNKAISLKPDYYKGYNNRGFAYFKIGKYQMAINDYNEAIRLKPNYAKAYVNRSNVFLNQGE
jgi:tetratricopeptide (TPR) repeat protein